MSDFVHLHVHSHYSLLQALPKIKDLVGAATKDKMSALALTDYNNMHGAVSFYKKCKDEGIKPILGVDLTVFEQDEMNTHNLVLLAKTNEGYKNLIRLVTIAHTKEDNHPVAISFEDLTRLSSDLICIIPSIESVLHHFDADDRAYVEKLRSMFGADNVYAELSIHPELLHHDELMAKLRTFAKEIHLPLVAAQDVSYIETEDRLARRVLEAIGEGQVVSEDEVAGGMTEDFSFTSTKQALKLFAKDPEALANVQKIVDSCTVDLTLGVWTFPDYEIPQGSTYDDELRRVAYAGIVSRKLEDTPQLRERIEYELDIIKNKGYSSYFLIVSDLLQHARTHDIVSTTRGSAAGSMVSYLTYITTVNPMEYKLPFERFLNPERPSAPDIDMDIADDKRDEMIAYAKEKYGVDKVAQIGTFGTMMARGAVRDVARALGYSYNEGDRIAKLIPMGSQGFPMTIKHAIEIEPDLKKIYKEEQDVREIVDMAQKIEGCARHISIHAAGVVISPTPLTDFTPLQLDPKGGKIITQYDMHGVEDAGLVKFDFLGIKNLAILADAIKRVKRIHGVEVDLDTVPLDDKKTFAMLAKGATIGLFQLSGAGMTRYLKDLRPTTIHDINAMVALYRPGPMESIPEYIKRKYNPELVTHIDPRMKDILSHSYGVITYQDDVMLIAINLAGYSWLEADKLRKAMGKKIPAEMEAQKIKLLEGFEKNGMSKQNAQHLWSLIEPFAAYGFNKCITGDALVVDGNTGKRIRIQDLYASHSIKNTTSLSEDKKIKPSAIKAVTENGIKEVFELTTRTGKKIKTTKEHRFLTIAGWKQLSEIGSGEHIALPRNIPTPKKTVRVPAYISATLGYLISEGNLCHPHGAYFYSANQKEVKDFIKHAEQFKHITCTIDNSKSATSVYCGTGGKQGNNTIMKWLKEMELLGKKATSKFIPEDVFGWDNTSISNFIGKLWQGDGCVAISSSQTYYATSSERLARDLTHLLLRLSVTSTLHTKKFKCRDGYKTGYVVIVTGSKNIIQFSTHILPHLVDKKKADLDTLTKESIRNIKRYGEAPARGTADIIPAQILTTIREKMLTAGISVKELSQKLNISQRLLSYDKRKKGYQRETLLKIGTYLKDKSLLEMATSDIFWDAIVDIKPAGKEMTYDVSMSKDHNFVANDIIVHNSHAASYGRVAYQTAYLKANFPATYLSAVLTADSGDTERIAETIEECNRLEIPVLPPDINESFEPFSVVKRDENDPQSVDKIRFGLLTIKNFGAGIAHAIVEERKAHGHFKSLEDFLTRVIDRNLNRKSLESLIKAGAMDAFGERGNMLHNIEDLLDYNKTLAKTAENQNSLFSLMDSVPSSGLHLEEGHPASFLDKLSWEKELLGLYVSGHPITHYADRFKDKPTIAKLAEESLEGTTVVVGGLLESSKEIFTKSGDKMSFASISDKSGKMEIVFFPKVFAEFKEYIKPGTCIAVKGKFSRRNDAPSILVERIKKVE